MKRNTWILILVIAILGLLLWGTREHFKDDEVTLQADGTQSSDGMDQMPGGSPPPPEDSAGGDPNAQTTSYGGDIQASYPDTSLASVSTDGNMQTTTDSSVAPTSAYVSDPTQFQPPTFTKDDTVTLQPATAAINIDSAGNPTSFIPGPTVTVADDPSSGGFSSTPAAVYSDPVPQMVDAYNPPVFATPMVQSAMNNPSVFSVPDIQIAEQTAPYNPPRFIKDDTISLPPAVMTQPSTLDAPIVVAPASAPVTTDTSTITAIAAQAAAQAVAQTTPPPAPPAQPPTVNINTAPAPATSPTTANATPISAPGVASYTSVCNWTMDANKNPVSSCQWYK